MRKIFSRRHKTHQPDAQNNPQESNLDADDQSANNIPIIEIQTSQQTDPAQNDASLPENNNDDDQENQSNLADEDSNSNSDGNEKKSRPGIKHASTVPLQNPTFYYTVQEGDTLQLISEKYHVKKSIIKKANRIYAESELKPGLVIQLFTEVDDTQKFHPIEVFVYEPKEQTDGLPGKLTIKKHNLVFIRKSIFHHSHHINLTGYLESDILPHPNQTDQTELNILAINYLKDPSDKKTSITEYFSGKKDDLEKLRIEIIKTADMTQEKVKYLAPNPDSIAFSQEFADKERIKNKSAEKRRNRRRGSNFKDDDEERSKNSPSGIQTMRVFLPKIQLLGGKLDIIKSTDVFLVRKKLPQRYQNANWKKLYKTVDDGSSLSVFFRRVGGRSPILFFMRTVDDDLVGAYVPSGLMASNSFYGNIDTFVFTIKTEIPKHDIFITRLADLDDNRNDSVNQNEHSILAVNEHNDDHLNSENMDQSGHSILAGDHINDDHLNSENKDQSGHSISANENKNDDQISSENKDQNDDHLNSENKNVNEDQISSENNDQNDHSILPKDENNNQNVKDSEANNQNNGQISSQSNNSETNNQNNENSNSQTNDQINSEKSNQPNSNSNKPSQKPRSVIEVFRWNRLQCLDNRNFVLSNTESIIFGGGNSSAIYIDSDMDGGFSDPCDTFCSPRLTKNRRFVVSAIEVWEIA